MSSTRPTASNTAKPACYGSGNSPGAPTSVPAPPLCQLPTGLTGLKLGVTYHYRVIATNADKTTAGPDRTFTTIPPALISACATRSRRSQPP